MPETCPPELLVPGELGAVTELLDTAAERWPGSWGYSFLGQQGSYRELRRDVDGLAVALVRLGVRRGDRVALVLPNCPQLLIGLHAVLRLGAVAVPLLPTCPPERLAAVFADSGAEVVLCLDRAYERVAQARRSAGTVVRELVVTALSDYLPAIDRLAMSRAGRVRAGAGQAPGSRVRRWTEELRRARGALSQSAPAGMDEPAVLAYDWGTRLDGPARVDDLLGAVLTGRNLLAAGEQCVAWLPHGRPGRETLLAGIPLCSAGGLAIAVVGAALVGACVLMLPRSNSMPRWSPLAATPPTVVVGTPELLADLVARGQEAGADLSRVRATVSGPLPEPLARRLGELTCGALIEGVGATGAAVVLGRRFEAGEALPPAAGPRRPGGRPLPGTELSVLDPAGRPVPPGVLGRLAVRGPQVFAGYWGRPADTAAVLSGGWLRTDLWGCLRPDGSYELDSSGGTR